MPFTPTSQTSETTTKRRILGIDPGVATTGYGIIDVRGNQNSWVTHGVIVTPKNTPLADRLLSIQKEIYHLCETYQPDTCGVEEIFFAKNTKTAILVAQARGAILLSVKSKGLRCYEFTPRQTKLAITGYGQAEKKQMQMMTQSTLQLPQLPTPDDAADALALALCTAQHLFALELKI